MSVYVETFINDHPKRTIETLHNRRVSALKLNEELADYFRDRAQIEDIYAKSLAKLSKKKYVTDQTALGSLLSVWKTLESETARLASIHGEYASLIMQEIEQPLRSSIRDNAEYKAVNEVKAYTTFKKCHNINDLLKIEENLKKVAREVDDLECKIQKYNRSSKVQAKSRELVQRYDRKLEEWKKSIPQALQKYQNIDEHRLTFLKSTVDTFELLQQSRAERVIELTADGIIAASNFNVYEEISSFCASHTDANPFEDTLHTENPHTMSLDTLVSENSFNSSHSSSDSSYMQSLRKEKKKIFQTLASIRGKPKSDYIHHHSNSSGSIFEASSINSSRNIRESSINTTFMNFNLVTQPSYDTQFDFTNTSVNTLPLAPPPHTHVDSEGYTIPPPDRVTKWAGDSEKTNSFLLDISDSSTESFSSVPRIYVDIKNETVKDGDIFDSAAALSKVANFLKETKSIPAKRLRGRRDTNSTRPFYDQEVPSTNDLTTVESIHVTFGEARINGVHPYEKPSTPTYRFSTQLPTIDVQIAETVNLVTRGGSIEESIILGELSIGYSGPSESATPICFKLDHSDKFESIDTTEFVSSVLNGHTLDDHVFKLNTQLFCTKQSNKHHVCIKYQRQLDKHRIPITVSPRWKCEDDKTRLLVKFRKCDTIAALENVMIGTSVTGKAKSAMSEPIGELDLAQNKISWDLGELHENESIIKAQFATLEQGTPQPIIVHFKASNHLLTDIQISQASANPILLWAKVSGITTSVKSGNYIAYM